VTVLFGGDDGSNYLGDTWEWDGLTWTLVATSGPTPSTGTALAFDSARSVTVLAGIYQPGQTGSTWEWDGLSWTLVTLDGPPWQEYHGMAYDSVRNVTVLTGGFTPSNESVDSGTWEYGSLAYPDIDRNCEIDASDQSLLGACLNGPDTLPLHEPCRDADLDLDGDIDMADYSELQQAANA
jgi:uncharacterized protein YfiM (DUF2279 family)